MSLNEIEYQLAYAHIGNLSIVGLLFIMDMRYHALHYSDYISIDYA